jgi:hypothetical protein
MKIRISHNYCNCDIIYVVEETTILRLTVGVGANRSGCVKGSVVSRGIRRAETRRGLAAGSIQSATPQQGTHALGAWHSWRHHHCIWNTGRSRLLQPAAQIYCLYKASPFTPIYIK